MIDKLDGHLRLPVLHEDLQRRAAAVGLTPRKTKLRGGGWYFEIGQGDRILHFRLGRPDNPLSSGLLSRPSAFETLAAYHTFLRQLLRDDELDELQISRLDIAIDYEIPLSSLLRGLDVTHKFARASYDDLGALRTGMLIGRGPEKILVYDKAYESGLPSPLTRIEIQLSGKKLPTRSYRNLAETLKTWSPFRAIHLHEVELASNFLSEAQQERRNQLHYLMERDGLLAARRVLNQNQNFDRDFSPLMALTPWSEQPSDAYTKGIRKFL